MKWSDTASSAMNLMKYTHIQVTAVDWRRRDGFAKKFLRENGPLKMAKLHQELRLCICRKIIYGLIVYSQ